jgi:hypothetical protein
LGKILDKALWISWYDLPAQARDEHVNWTHRTHIPDLLQRSGVSWVAHYASAKLPKADRIRHTSDPTVPVGTEYMLIVGAESSHVFSKDARSFAAGHVTRWDASSSKIDQAMLSARLGERISILTEEARVDGPDAAQRAGRALGPCIQLGSYNAETSDLEEELLAWYADWRFPAMASLTGCIGVRKMVSVVGWAKHAVIYEFVSVEARAEGVKQIPRLYPEMEAWTDRFIPHLVHSAGSPNVARRIWPE